jgi:hypothetical protein
MRELLDSLSVVEGKSIGPMAGILLIGVWLDA